MDLHPSDPRMRRLALLLCLTLPFAALAQNAPRPPVDQPLLQAVPAAAPKDVESIESILAALYDVISGDPGQARDWNRFRSLFVPTARMMPLVPRPEGQVGVRMLAPNDYVASSGPLLLEKGFHEREVARRIERFGHLAHVFSTYEARIVKDDHMMRGINSIQLMHDGKRWWIVSLMWEAESDTLKLPAEYLK
jgi:hypothetical protein